MQELQQSLGFFTTNQYARSQAVQKKPEYNTHIDTLRSQLPNVSPDDFKKLPEYVRKDIFKNEFETRCTIYPFVQGTGVEAVAFKIPSFRRHIQEGACTFSEGNTHLSISSKSLNTEHIAEILANLPNKEKIVQLNLSGCNGLAGLKREDHSLLEGFNELKQLTLPRTASFTSMEGIQVVKGHLEELDISGTGIQTLGALRGFSLLARLSCAASGNLADLDGLSGCPQIKHLVLSQCSQIPYEWLKKLQELPNLQTCDLTKTRTLNDLKPFVGLSNLERIIIPATAAQEPALPDTVEVVVGQ